MAASKVNYIVTYDGHSQVYGCSSKKIALESSPPEGYSLKDKKVLFLTFEPDTNSLCVYKIEDEEIMNAEIKARKEKKKDDEE